MKRFGALAAVVLVAGCSGRRSEPVVPYPLLNAELDSAFAAPEYARASWGVVIRSLDNGQVLYSRNAERLFMPASNQKIMTSAVALVRLGAEFRYRTPVLLRGHRTGDTLDGDLVVVGRGDPSISWRVFASTDPLAPLRGWADSLRARGIGVIRGRVVGDASYFPDAIYGEGWMWDDLPDSYSAPVGALMVNDGSMLLEVTPGAPGMPAALVMRPSRTPLRLFGGYLSLPPESSAVARVRWSRALAGDSVSLWGTIARQATFELAVRDPTEYFVATLRQALEEGGVRIDTATANRHPATGADPCRAPVAGCPLPAADTLFWWTSPPLRDILPHFMKPSQNQIGEMLLRTVGGVAKGTASVDSGRAAARETLTSFGIPDNAYVMADGSGLSRYNYLAPEAIARILYAMAHRPDFDVYLASFPIAGVDGTIANRMRGTAAMGNVRAKTGSISNARTLSGYVTTRDGERLLFVLMANHFTSPNRVIERTQDFVTERLANFTRR